MAIHRDRVLSSKGSNPFSHSYVKVGKNEKTVLCTCTKVCKKRVRCLGC